jgi:ABC-type antimicrobial peptide transport system permease subunit
VTSLDRDAVVDRPQALSALMWTSIAERRFHLLMFGVFAAAGVLVAALGVFAVVAYSVGQRTREIGIRMAIGARGRDILHTITSGVLKWVGVGSIAGLAAAVVLTRLLRAIVYPLTPTDPLTFALVVICLTGVAIAAALIPARRALTINPVDALRAE